MRAKPLCLALALGLLLVPAGGAHDDARDDADGDGNLHCPPFLDENGSPHMHCFCPLEPDPLGLCDEELDG